LRLRIFWLAVHAGLARKENSHNNPAWERRLGLKV
jgi:hypothetical protein